MGLVGVGGAGGAVTITVIDQSDVTGWMEAATRWGEHEMTDVASFVRVVQQAAGNRRIARLNIFDHGNSQGFEIGTDWISTSTLSGHSTQLRALRGMFAPNAYVFIGACEVGQARQLMQMLADLWGVKVVAGTGKQNNVYRINFGTYYECSPGAGCRQSNDQGGALRF
jgi:hypothetical protein